MITVHHLNNSRSQRVLWLLEELEVAYEIKRYQRDPVSMLAPNSLRDVHPLGKSPVLEDDGRILIESGAIVEYLVERYGAEKLPIPTDVDLRLRYRQWIHYAEGSAMPPLLLKLVFDRMEKADAPFIVKPLVKKIADTVRTSFITPQIKLHLDFLESELERDAWFAGPNFTAADIQMSFPLEVAAARGGLDSTRPRLHALLQTLQARPAYQAALARGGHYEIL